MDDMHSRVRMRGCARRSLHAPPPPPAAARGAVGPVPAPCFKGSARDPYHCGGGGGGGKSRCPTL